MSTLYQLVEPALVGAGVLLALGVAVKRFLPRRRDASARAAGCSACSGCGACASAAEVEPQVKPIVVLPPPRAPKAGATAAATTTSQSGRGPASIST